MSDLVAGEWLKLRTTRLLAGMVPTAMLLSVLAVAGTALATDRSDVGLESAEGIRRILSVTGTGALVMLLLGVLISAGEHRHGTIADTFLTTPRRQRVVAAKVVVGAAVGLAGGALIAVTSLGAAALVYTAKGSSFPFDDTTVWATLAGAVVYATLFTVLGVAVGTLVRNQVLAVALALAWIAIVEHILVNFAPTVGKWLPAAAGQAIVRTPLDDLLPSLGGVAVLAAYVLAVAVAGARITAARDV